MASAAPTRPPTGARIATRYRSEYIGEVTNFANDRALRYVDSDMITDAQVSYLFSEGMFEGVQLLFQVNNLNNEPFRTEVSDSNGLGLFFPEEYTEYGRQYMLGFRYTL